MLNRTRDIERLFEGLRVLKMQIAAGVRRFPREPRLTHARLAAFFTLAKRGALSIKELSEALHISSSAATQIVNDLAKAGRVARKRNRADARVTVIALTPSARREFVAARGALLAGLAKTFSALTDREFKTYLALNEKIIRAAGDNPQP